MGTSLIRPGLLVSLKSSVEGGVQYTRRNLEDETTDTGAAHTKWETDKLVDDPEEHDRASKVRSKALSEIRGVCSHTAFGLLCPESFEAKLDEAVARARAIVAEHNATAQRTFVEIYCLKGRIASSDEEAARAIGSEVAGLIDAMNRAIDKLDPEAIRAAADKARSISTVLDEAQAAKVSDAIAQARKAARTIVKRIEKDGENAAFVLKDIQRGDIEKARIAFLDLDTPEVAADAPPSAPAVDVNRLASLDVADASTPELADAPAHPVVALEVA